MTKLKPVFMRPNEIFSVKEAAGYAARDEKLIRSWVRAYGIGRQVQPHSKIEISRIALDMVLQGDAEALELLRDGDRLHADVVRYFKFAGIEP